MAREHRIVDRGDVFTKELLHRTLDMRVTQQQQKLQRDRSHS